MNLRNLNKGQKILLFVFLPVMLIIISIAITIIFDDSNKNDDQLSSSTDAINVDIPDTFAKPMLIKRIKMHKININESGKVILISENIFRNLIPRITHPMKKK